MYYPKSQIQTNLYTKGKEYYVKSTNEDYKGYYYRVSNDTYFTGKTPQEPNSGLTLIKYTTPPSLQEIENPTNSANKNVYSVIEDESYNKSKNLTPSQKLYSLPIAFYPKPIELDYELGEFERYFLAKTNEIKFLEVDAFTHAQYLNKDRSVAYQLFFPLKASWVLTGVREEVYQVNYRTIEQIQNNNQLRGFIEYFRGRFDKYYK
jgi:hypothetical protein